MANERIEEKVRKWLNTKLADYRILSQQTKVVLGDNIAMVRDLLAAYDEAMGRVEKLVVCPSWVNRNCIEADAYQDLKAANDRLEVDNKNLKDALVLRQCAYDQLALASNANKRLREVLTHIISEGHNDDCLFCGLKDRRAAEAVKGE